MALNLTEEQRWWEAGFRSIAGIDEAGRGPLAGPVVAAAVIFHPSLDTNTKALSRVRDSKLLSRYQREELSEVIKAHALAYAISSVSHTIIDERGIVPATKLAMTRTIRKLAVTPDIILTDAVSLDMREIPQRAIVHGDVNVFSIAAASILAKVARDKLMQNYARRFPEFSFSAHKGYGTPVHLAELKKYGPSALHRRTFAPVNRYSH